MIQQPAPQLERSELALGDLATDHVTMVSDEASELARRWWTLDATAERMETEKDDTFRLETRGGERFVLKVAHPLEDRTGIEFESSLLSHVHRVAPDLPLPHVVHAVGDRPMIVIRDRAGQERLARLLSWLEGTPLDSTTSSPLQRELLGEALAKLRHATAGFAHPGDRRRCAWDIAHLPDLAPVLEHLELDPPRKAMLHEGMARYLQVAAPRVAGLRKQVLHNDFSKSNLIVDHGDPAFLTGIIDFGDTVHTAIAIDVSTALLNQLSREPADDLFADGRDLLRGYLRHADLSSDELALLPHLVMGRVVARAMITLYRAGKMPGNARYIARNTNQGWVQLPWFLERSVNELSASFI
jgi:Ser/Thr protein kinase RdoA (MazF antagonist)